MYSTKWARRLGAAVAALLVLGLGGCAEPDSSPSPTLVPGSTVRLVTHDSFVLSGELQAAFEQQYGVQLEVSKTGDAGQLVNQLVLTKNNPLGDVVFGIDNTFASRAVAEGVVEPYTPQVPAATDAAKYAVGGGGQLVAIDYGDVCINADDRWFTQRGLAVPQTLSDLTKPAYKSLLVVSSASTSSPGLAFLLATIGAFGPDGWKGYWRDLVANDVRIVPGWSDAYYTDFTAGGGSGSRPLVLSYASSPPFTIPEGGSEPVTSALLQTCFRQVEYAGVLAGAGNPAGARAFIDFMLSDQFQVQIPQTMYVYPVSSSVDLPAEWAKWAPLAPSPFTVDPAEIAANRDTWIQEWMEIVGA